MFWSILTGFRTGFLGSDGSNPEPNLNRTQKQVRGSAFCPNRTQVQVRGSEKRVSEPNRTELSQHYYTSFQSKLSVIMLDFIFFLGSRKGRYADPSPTEAAPWQSIPAQAVHS